jgi:hypothetical protein
VKVLVLININICILIQLPNKCVLILIWNLSIFGLNIY